MRSPDGAAATSGETGVLSVFSLYMVPRAWAGVLRPPEDH